MGAVAARRVLENVGVFRAAAGAAAALATDVVTQAIPPEGYTAQASGDPLDAGIYQTNAAASTDSFDVDGISPAGLA